VCTGGKSQADVEKAIQAVSKEIRRTGQRITSKPEIVVQNIVASSDLGSEIDLNEIAVTMGLEHVEYEPEQFPGLVYRMEDPRTVILLFGSGKLVCTGAKRLSDVERAVKKIDKELRAAGLLR